MLSVTTPALTLLSAHPRTHRSDWEELSSTDSLLSPCSLWNTCPHTCDQFLAVFCDTVRVCDNQLDNRQTLVAMARSFPSSDGFCV